MPQLCPECKQNTFERDSHHEWVHVDRKIGNPTTLTHQKQRCTNVDCRYEQDGCKNRRRELLRLFALGDLQTNQLFDCQCEVLEKDIEVSLVRIITAFHIGDMANAVEWLTKLEANEASHPLRAEHENLLLILHCAVSYFSKDLEDVRRNIQKLGKAYEKQEKSVEFLADLLLCIVSIDSVGSTGYEDLKGKWFRDFKTPFKLFDDEVFSLIVDSIDAKTILLLLFRSECFFRSVPLKILNAIVRRSAIKTRWPNDEVVFWETLTNHIVQSDDDPEEGTSDPLWYRHLKPMVNQLAFDILCEQELPERGFSYLEDVGLNYLNAKEHLGLNDLEIDDLFEVSEYFFPYNPPKDTWLSESDVTEVCWQCSYAQTWGLVLQYLTVVEFYQLQLRDPEKDAFHHLIEDRIMNIDASTSERSDGERERDQHENTQDRGRGLREKR